MSMFSILLVVNMRLKLEGVLTRTNRVFGSVSQRKKKPQSNLSVSTRANQTLSWVGAFPTKLVFSGRSCSSVI